MAPNGKLRQVARQWLHRCVLNFGFSLQRVNPFERTLLKYMLNRPEFWLVQVGAYNGITSDPFCKFLIDGLWKAVLIEPQRRYCDILREIYHDRPDIKCRNVAISSSNSTQPLFQIASDAPNMPYWAPQLASFRYDVVASHRDRIPNIEAHIVSELVECVTLDKLIDQERLPAIDLLAIDVEGSDFEVLKQISSLTIFPKFIYYEHLHLSSSDREESYQFLRQHGYKVHAVNDGDSFAERRT